MIEVLIDGAARGQGMSDDPQRGEAAIGIAIYRNHECIGQFARGLGRRSNNEAEYEALIHAILICWAADLNDPLIYSDSQLIVNQVLGNYRCRSASLIPLLATVSELQKVYTFRIQAVPRKFVAPADQLAKDFLDDLLLSNKEIHQRNKRKRK